MVLTKQGYCAGRRLPTRLPGAHGALPNPSGLAFHVWGGPKGGLCHRQRCMHVQPGLCRIRLRQLLA